MVVIIKNLEVQLDSNDFRQAVPSFRERMERTEQRTGDLHSDPVTSVLWFENFICFYFSMCRVLKISTLTILKILNTFCKSYQIFGQSRP